MKMEIQKCGGYKLVIRSRDGVERDRKNSALADIWR